MTNVEIANTIRDVVAEVTGQTLGPRNPIKYDQPHSPTQGGFVVHSYYGVPLYILTPGGPRRSMRVTQTTAT